MAYYDKAADLFREGKIVAEIATMLNLSPVSVKQYLKYARMAGTLESTARTKVKRSVVLSDSARLKLRAAAQARGILEVELTRRLLEAAAECVDAVLDDGGGVGES